MPTPPHPTEPNPQPAQSIAARQEPSVLGRELGGDLPCFVCGYNLRGLSVRSMCPECGTLVRATILSLVDPYASVLQPIPLPRLLASGLVLWAGGATLAALLSWLPHTADLLHLLNVHVARPNITLGVALGVVASALGSLVLIRPHAGLPVLHSVLAAIGSLLYVPLAVALWRYHTISDSASGPRYVAGWSPSVEATRLLVASSLIIAAIIIAQRPMARTLVARSLLMRSGRVDRQTMYAMALAAVIAAAGAAMGWAARGSTPVLSESARVIGIVFIATGSMLLTIGVLGSLLDAARIAQAVISPRPTLRQVIRDGRPGPRSRLGRMLEQAPKNGDGA